MAAAQHVPPGRAIGVGADRSATLDPGLRPVVLTWAVTHDDVIVLDVIEALVEGRLEPGVRTLGLRDGAVGIATDGLPPDVVTQIEDLTERVVAGQISVPTAP
jgi:basic membrane lipoprotein Med (substrate-binding protein (PBP1-ABC) superfamily)